MNQIDILKNVLKNAQKLGYAEPGNPKLDLNGYDALAKVKILSALAFNCKSIDSWKIVFLFISKNNNFSI